MKDLVERIYNDILVCEEDTVKIDNQASREIRKIAERYPGLTDSEQEKLKDILFEAASFAEYAGIKIGIKFTLDLFLSVYGD